MRRQKEDANQESPYTLPSYASDMGKKGGGRKGGREERTFVTAGVSLASLQDLDD